MIDDVTAIRPREGDEAIRQTAMIRGTLVQWIEDADEAARIARDDTEAWTRYRAQGDAYRLCLALFGPEPAWTTDDDGEPF